MYRFLFLIVLTCPAVSRAADSWDVLPADGTPQPSRMVRAWLMQTAQVHFDARRATVESLKKSEQIAARQSELRAKFIAALGGLPERTPLNAQVVGQERRDGYRIEKVIYESRPRHHVTATLYLPEGKSPAPGILMPIGHSSNGKAAEYIQRGAILLAKHGFVVLAYDPIGQGERHQLLDANGKPAIPASTSQHTLVGIGALLVGRNTAHYRVWDGLRSLDYLAGRPEVDPARLGCTGCSGGGTLTSYLMSLDERIACAAPSCYITSLERLFATIGPQDAEQNIPGQVAFGMEHADYVTMRAPRPTLLCAATRDFFDIQGTWTTLREAKRTYGLLGYGERVDLFESDTSHGFPRSQREAALRWFQRWLMHKDEASVEDDFLIAKDSELRCTPSGHVLADLKGVSAFDLNAARLDELERSREEQRTSRTKEALVAQISRRLALSKTAKAAVIEGVPARKHGTSTARLLEFHTEPGIVVPGVLVTPAEAVEGPLAIVLASSGKSAALGAGGIVEKLTADRKQVLALDVRAVGETAPGRVDRARPSYFGSEWFESFVSMHVNRPLLGQQVADLLAVVARLAADHPHGFTLHADGPLGDVALHAAVLDERIREVTLERSLVSWASVVRTPISYGQLAHAVFGVLEDYDFPDLAAAVAPRPLTIRQSLDAAGRGVSQAAIESTYAPAIAAYRDRQAAASLQLEAAGE